MGQRRKDRTWPRPRQTRHAWFTRPGVHEAPVQAFIIAWRRHSYRWQAYIIWVSDSGKVIQEWVAVERLGPVPALDRQMPGNPNYSPRL